MNFLSGKKKILTLVAGVVCGICMFFGADATAISQISGAVVTIGSVVSYLVVEGKIDVTRIKQAADAAQTIVENVEDATDAED